MICMYSRTARVLNGVDDGFVALEVDDLCGCGADDVREMVVGSCRVYVLSVVSAPRTTPMMS